MTDRKRATFALAVLFSLNLMNFLDRQIVGAITEPLRKDWGLTDGEIGMLGTAFTLLYAILGVPLGRLADQSTRKWILAAGAFVWSALTVVSGIARNFSELFAARLGVGVGEAVCTPAATSLIGDLYPAHNRARAMSIFMLGLPFGLGLGYAIGGWAAQEFGWRSAFFFAGAPGILCAAAALFMHEPKRGATEVHDIGACCRSGSPYRVVLSIPTMWCLVGGGIMHTFIFYAVGSFLSSFLIRYHGVGLRQAGLISMVVYGLSGAPVLLLSGAVTDAFLKRKSNGRMLAGCLFVSVSAPAMFLALSRPAGDTVGFGILMGIGCGALYAYYSAVYPTIADIVEPALRGTALAVYFCAMYVLGAALGPLGTGLASDFFTMRAAEAAGVTTFTRQALEPFRASGLHSAMYIVPCLSVMVAIFLYTASRTVGRDVGRLNAWMQESAKPGARSAAAD